VLKAAALEVILELLLHIPRQDRALRQQVGLEHGIIFLDKLIKEERSERWRAYTGAPTPELASLPAGNGNMKNITEK
jgi:hypothetical protein